MPPMSSSTRSAARRQSSNSAVEGRLLQPRRGEPIGRFIKGWSFKISLLIKKYREAAGRPTLRPDYRGYLAFLRSNYLPGLRSEIDMHRRLAKYINLERTLQHLADPDNYLPEDVRISAEALYTNFEERGWSGKASAPVPRRRSLGEYPPEDHPIYGRGGIMDGLLPTATVYTIDDRRRQPSAEDYGHINELVPGFWTPYQVGLVLHGGHQNHQRGIAGNENLGAYSIVISNKYGDLDVDEGNVVYYSGEGSHSQNRDSDKLERKKANRAMNASITYRKPVRVFRAAKDGSRYAPRRGYRYDGLYECVGKEFRRNVSGTRYQRFKLVRLEHGQPSLESIMDSSPTPQQISDYSKIQEGF